MLSGDLSWVLYFLLLFSYKVSTYATWLCPALRQNLCAAKIYFVENYKIKARRNCFQFIMWTSFACPPELKLHLGRPVNALSPFTHQGSKTPNPKFITKNVSCSHAATSKVLLSADLPVTDEWIILILLLTFPNKYQTFESEERILEKYIEKQSVIIIPTTTSLASHLADFLICPNWQHICQN